MDVLWQYLAFVNVVGFILFCYDKFLAKAHQRRIPESALMAVAAIGGAAGCWLAMCFVRHKSRKWKFKLGIPFFFFLHVAVGLFVIFYWDLL